MKKLLELLKAMRDRGLISEYALGGATALIYYFEPIQTQDIDVFIVLQKQDSPPRIFVAPRFASRRSST